MTYKFEYKELPGQDWNIDTYYTFFRNTDTTQQYWTLLIWHVHPRFWAPVNEDFVAMDDWAEYILLESNFLGKRFIYHYCLILEEITTASQHSPIFNEICTAAPPRQGKLLRSPSPWINTQQHVKRRSTICGKNLLPTILDPHSIRLIFSMSLRIWKKTKHHLCLALMLLNFSAFPVISWTRAKQCVIGSNLKCNCI